MNLESLRRRLSSDEINALPLCHYEGPIHLVRSLEDWEKALPDLQQEQVLGFDTETRPSFRKGRVNTPSLVQLATARAVYLVQLSWWPFGPELAGLLADPAVIKAGVAIGDDMRELARLYPFKPAGMVDLGMVARAVSFNPEYFSRLFTKEVGMNFSVFLNNLRMRQAVELLEHSDRKVYEIAEEVGYSSLSYFSTVFKKSFGQTPAEYQALNKKK